MERLKIFIAEDNVSFLEGVILYLEQILKHEVIGHVSDGEEFINQRDKIQDADIILIDIQMPKINGILATKKMLWMNYTNQVIALTALQSVVGLIQLVNAGFKACVYKNRVYNDLPQAINAVTNGRMYYPIPEFGNK
jgi:DNA-binding NarL/FixJ family response regulator